MATDDLEWLGTWYQQQCNGKWEHQKGMLLEPLNHGERTLEPGSGSSRKAGWRLRIDLRGTAAAGAAPRRLAVCALHGTWLRCALKAQRFEGEGADVEELIGVFRCWVDSAGWTDGTDASDRSAAQRIIRPMRPMLGAVSAG